MTAQPLSFFTVDRGTASTSAALIAPYGGRFRLLAAATAPREVDPEAILEDLVEGIRSMEPRVLPGAADWPSWARLEVATHPPLQVICAAASERRADDLARALQGAGWQVVARAVGERADPMAITEAAVRGEVRAVAIAANDPAAADERQGLAAVVAILGAAASRRRDLGVILAGGASAWADSFPSGRVVTGPAPRPDEGTSPTGLRELCLSLAARWSADGETSLDVADGRRAFGDGAVTLASLLERTVDAVDVGHSAGGRIVATSQGTVEHFVDADAALVHRRALSEDSEADTIIRWCALRADPAVLRDRVRDLRLEAWRDSSEDGARLRLAALRAALARLAGSWAAARSARAGAPRPFPRGRPASTTASPGPGPQGELLIASGGAFAAVPPPLAALALLDVFRRPGALRMLWDHARVLAPIGSLPSDSDRRRLYSDLLDDAFLPIASALVVADVRSGRESGRLRLVSPLQTTEAALAPGELRVFDLPPGLVARAELEAREPVRLAVRARHVTMDVAGGLGGLLVDTREHPLRLPEQAEARRSLLQSWEGPLWSRGGA